MPQPATIDKSPHPLRLTPTDINIPIWSSHQPISALRRRLWSGVPGSICSSVFETEATTPRQRRQGLDPPPFTAKSGRIYGLSGTSQPCTAFSAVQIQITWNAECQPEHGVSHQLLQIRWQWIFRIHTWFYETWGNVLVQSAPQSWLPHGSLGICPRKGKAFWCFLAVFVRILAT